MPFFKIRSPSSVKYMIKSDTISEIILKAVEKLKLPGDVEYKLILENDGTEFDDDEILLEYAKESSETLVLLIIPKDSEWKNDSEKENNTIALNAIVSNTVTSSESDAQKTPSTSQSEIKVLNLDEIVWSKTSDKIRQACKNGETLDPRDRREIVRCIRDYMIDKKNTSRTLAGEFAKKLCNIYPETFCDKVGGDNNKDTEQVWGNGIETLTIQIYNCVKYQENLSKSKSRKRVIVSERDSDDDVIEARAEEEKLSEKWDEYGCVAYAPDLPEDENSVSQDSKRLILKRLFEDPHSDMSEVTRLMAETYCTQRAVLNEVTRDLNDFIINWPFFVNPICFLEHATTLLGKNVAQVWIKTLQKKNQSIRLYMKTSKTIKDNQKDEITDVFNRSKEFVNVNKSQIHKTLVVFPLLAIAFGEKINCLYKLVGVDSHDDQDDNGEASLVTGYPLLVIEGKSLYQESSKFSVVVSEGIRVNCTDALQGLLITFLSYYVFGLKYNPAIEKTLEFLQRFFLNIHPKIGSKKNKSKRMRKAYDQAVFKLAKQLLEFSDDFKME